MHIMKRAAARWSIAGLLVCLCTLAVVIWGTHSSPVVLVDPHAIEDAADSVMAAAVSGDYGTLEGLLYGVPQLGQAPAADDSAEGMLWQAYLDSIEYRFPGSCYSLDSQLALDVSITCLDISAVTETLQETAPGIMAEMASQITEESEVYDKGHNYLDSFLADVMKAAAAKALAQDMPVAEHTLTLRLVRSGGGWQVVPTEALLQFLSGYVSG